MAVMHDHNGNRRSRWAAVVLLLCFTSCRKAVTAPEKPSYDSGSRIVVVSVKPPASKEPKESGRSYVSRYGLLDADYELITATVDNIRTAIPMRVVRKEVRNGDRNEAARVIGTPPAHAASFGLKIGRGNFFKEDDERQAKNVAVVSDKLAVKLFGAGDPLGKTIRIAGQPYQIVGRLTKSTANASGRPTGGRAIASDPSVLDVDVYVPLKTMRNQINIGNLDVQRGTGSFSADQVELHELHIAVKDSGKIEETANAIKLILQKHHSEKGDVAVKIVP